MIEDWRKKTYYDKRVLIDTTRIITPQLEGTIICLTGEQVEMLRNMTQYLHRRSTFSEELTKQGYLTPTNEDWSTIQSIVAHLEESLMGCDIETIVAAIEAQTAAIEAQSLCLCAMNDKAASQLPVQLSEHGEELSPDMDDEIAMKALSLPSADGDLCDLANVIVGFTFEFITETLLPFANGALDTAAAALGATTLFTILSGGLGLSLALVTALFYALVQWLADSATSNLINWMFGNAQELVCLLFEGFKYGGYNTAMLSVTDYIDNSTLPHGDHMMLKLSLTSTWFYRAMQYQIDAAALDPSDYPNYSCAGCTSSPYFYFWNGKDCPDGNLTGTNCQDDYPVVAVAETAETEEPWVENTSEEDVYACTWAAGPRLTFGGNTILQMRRLDSGLVLEDHTFNVILGGGVQIFTHEFTAQPTHDVYFTFGNVGATANYIYWMGCTPV